MALSEKEVKLEARLLAIEHVLSNTLANIYLFGGYSREQIIAGHVATTESLKNETIPGAPSEQGDMWTSEMEQAVTSLQSLALKTWEAKISQL